MLSMTDGTSYPRRSKLFTDSLQFTNSTHSTHLNIGINSSGKIIIRGSTEDTIIEAFYNILPLFKEVKKK